MKEIHLFRPKYRIDECLSQIRECLESGWTGFGWKTIEFEYAWQKYTGLPNAHFISSATAGLHLAVKILKDTYGWGSGDTIITTPFTFVSTNHAILYEGLTPVFVDIDEHLCLDPEKVEAAINNSTRAVIFVGIGGNTGRLRDISELCRRKKLKLILDAAHMAGTRLNGTHVGQEADVSVFSFHSVKNLPTADGGMICFQDHALDILVRKLSWMGISSDTFTRTISGGKNRWKYEVDQLGYKYHGNSVMAALGLVGLEYLDQDNQRRREIAAVYDKGLESVRAGIQFVPIPNGCESSRHLYQILVDDRDTLIQKLNGSAVYPGVHYRSCTEYSLYKPYGACPRAEDAARRIISLPIHLHLEDSDVRTVCEKLAEAIPIRS